MIQTKQIYKSAAALLFMNLQIVYNYLKLLFFLEYLVMLILVICGQFYTKTLIDFVNQSVLSSGNML